MDIKTDYKTLWNTAFEGIKLRLNKEGFDWANNLDFSGSTGQTLILSTSSKFQRDQIIKRYGRLIEEELEKAAGQKITVIIEVSKDQDKTVPHSRKALAEETPDKKAREPSRIVAAAKPKKERNQQLREEFTFENYVVGENNVLPVNAAMAISRNPGTTSYNPLFIYGGVGLGKTHLLHAIGNYVHETSASKIIYVSAESFTNEFLDSLKENSMSSFKRKYRKNVDLLLIDDIHFLQGKKQTQEELFYTFNELINAKKQMVFTCDRPVGELRDFTERLTTRLTSGLAADLLMPDFETRCAILQKKVEHSDFNIPNDVIALVCKNISSNTRDLVAALNKLIAYADLVKKPVTIDLAQQTLRDIFTSPKQLNLSLENIIRVVADYFSLSPNDLKGKKKTQNIVHPRHLAMYIAHEITDYSTNEIGQAFGRDHTTVLHAFDQIEKKKISDPTEESTIQNIIRRAKESSIK